MADNVRAMKLPVIKKQEPLLVEAGVSKLAKVEFARMPRPALLKEPAHFWDEIFIANEASLLAGLTHPRIRHMLAYEAESHRLFLEYIEGATLHELVKTGVTLQDPQRTHQLLRCVAETMADLHAGILCDRPMVHNDLKSMNVLVPAESPQEARLIDFSHAYFRDSSPPLAEDKRQDRAGTAKYMAPEKWEGDHAHGCESDVFAFGVLAYYAHTGRYPFDGEVARIEQQVREVTPPSPLELRSGVLRTTVASIMSCLEKNPSRRPSMDTVARCYADSASLFR